ncbi:MAG: hypothetical protein LBG58_05100 [Planctomycetaceae bacterium]|jgi:hypothetical protein|nr:hypothetical protein [Planctomycetaceae bacterium]
MLAKVISILDGQCGSEADIIVGRWHQYICFLFTFTFLLGVSNLIIGEDGLWVKQKILNQTGQVTG